MDHQAKKFFKLLSGLLLIFFFKRFKIILLTKLKNPERLKFVYKNTSMK